MATNLEGNVQLQRFIELLSNLNHQTVDMLKTGDTNILFGMNFCQFITYFTVNLSF